MQDKEYDHSLKVDPEKKKKEVELDDEVSLKVNRSYEVNESFIIEQKKCKVASRIRFVRSVNCGGCSTH